MERTSNAHRHDMAYGGCHQQHTDVRDERILQPRKSSGYLRRRVGCMAAKRHISARLVERSDSASAYCGELLGMLAIHVILYAIEEYYGVTGDSKVLWDNK